MSISKLTFYQYIPGLCLIVFVFLSVFTGIQSLAYIAIFYWSVFRADLVPVSLLGALGLVYDSVCSHFLGEETFVYLMLMGLVFMDRRFLLHREFNYLWKSIGALIILISIGKWTLALHLNLVFSVLHQSYDAVVGILLFPAYVRVISPIYSKFATL